MKKKADPEPKDYVLFPKEPPLPPCPFNCRRKKLVGVWVHGRQQDLDVTTGPEPCEHQIAAVEQMAFERNYMQVWDPSREEWNVQPRRR